MVRNGSVAGKELHFAELMAQAGEELETFVNVVRWIGKIAAHHDDPAVDRRRNKKPGLEGSGQGIAPHAGARMLDAERRLDGLRILRAHREPAARRFED